MQQICHGGRCTWTFSETPKTAERACYVLGLKFSSHGSRLMGTQIQHQEIPQKMIDHQLETIVLGGGCFWCTEAVYKGVRGVLDVESGYCNGQAYPPPSYDDVCSGRTGCNEVVKLQYDPSQVSTRQLLEIFFSIHDPTTLHRQGNDVGTQYRSGIYFTTVSQGNIAQELMDELASASIFDDPIVTELLPLQHYWPAENYHQDFFERNPYQGYCIAVAAPKLAKFRKTFPHLAR